MPRQKHSHCKKVRLPACELVPDAVPVLRCYGEAPDVSALCGGLNVAPVREFEITVPHTLLETGSQIKEPRNVVNQLGPLFEIEVPVATTNDYDSFMAAFNKRCNFVAHDDIEDAAYRMACRLIDTMPDTYINDQWDENEYDRSRWEAKFGSAKLLRMQHAWQEFDEIDYRALGQKELSVKQEILLKRSDPTWAPRIIYAGSDTYNAVTGPCAMVATERFFSLVEQSKMCGVDVRFAYKKSDVEVAAHLCHTDFEFTAEGDYSRNDREQRARVHWLFDRMLAKIGMPSWWRKLEIEISKSFSVINFEHGLRAQLCHQLPTGTTITTVRNSFYNWVMYTTMCQTQGITSRAVILGDDLAAVTDKPVDLAAWVVHVNAFKMVLKAASPKLQAEMTFLSKRFFNDVETPCMIPRVAKALLRFNARGTKNNGCTDSCYMAGKALSYAYEFRHVPFMRDYFMRRFELEQDHSHVTTDELSWFARTSNHTIEEISWWIQNDPIIVTDDDLEWLMIQAYDIDIGELKELCDLVLVSKEPVLVTHPADFKLLVDV